MGRKKHLQLIHQCAFSIVLISIVLLSGCSLAGSSDGSDKEKAGSEFADSWTPKIVWVKYRSDPVDVAAPYFEALGPRSSSLVDDAWYDSRNGYMVIVLKGVAYHYCEFDSAVWERFKQAESLGTFYSRFVRGNYDCRISTVPTYP